MAEMFEQGAIRKSFSADKPKDSEFVDILQVGNKSNKTCASASFLSSRSNHRSLQGSLDISPNYMKLESNEDHKLFLKASQTLEKLNRIITKSNKNSGKSGTGCESSSNQRNLSLRKIILYHDVLKNLLRERCALILKEECDICIKRTTRLIEDFKQLYINEKLKMMTMPIQACNRFVNCNDTSFSTMELLIKKLQVICDLYSSISSSYQKIVYCFHIGFDMGLYLIVLKTNQTLKELKRDLFYWAHKSMTMFMKKLCLADPHSVSPDFLQSILESCLSFNLLVKDADNLSYDSYKPCDLFHRHGISLNCTELPFSLVLNYLSYFEAKVASEKIVHFLTSSCKKLRHIDLKKKCDTSLNKKRDDTSDYSSAASDLDLDSSSVKMFTVANINFNYTNVWTSIVQRNQSLILKYLYSITSLQSSSLSFTKKRASIDSHAKLPFSARSSWNLPDQSIQDERYILLEDMFWTSFWTNAQKFILKLLFEVPYHQYGDAVAGSIVLWPEDFLHSLTECLKLNFNNTDVPSEGRYVTKQVYEYLLLHRKQLLWDQDFSVALGATHAHICSLVPTVEKPMRTYTGNIFYSCLEILSDIFSEDFVEMDSMLTLKALRMLQTTLDCFNSWANTKTRALMSSQNLSSYLHVSCSDCSSCSKLLASRVKSVLSADFSSSSFHRISPNRRYLEQTVLTLIENLSGYQEDAQHLLYKFCFLSVKDILTSSLKPDNSCIFFKENATNAIETFLYSLDEAVKNLCDIFPLAQSITSGVSQAFFFILWRNKSLRYNSIQLLSNEFSKFLEWIDQLNLSEAEKEELKQKHSVKRICCLLKLIQKSFTRHKSCFKQRNKITPITEIQLDVCELNVEEKKILSMYSRKLFSCF